jgi:hypothetical protein
VAIDSNSKLYMPFTPSPHQPERRHFRKEIKTTKIFIIYIS